MNRIVQFIDVTKKYGRNYALKSVNFTAAKGEVFCLAGRENAGKTTALEIMASIKRPNSGSVRVSNTDVFSYGERVRSFIGVVFSHSYMDRNVSVRRNLELRAGMYYDSYDEIKKQVDKVIDVFGLHKNINTIYSKASDSVRRRADIARAFINDPSVVIMDNATEALDITERNALWKFLNYKVDKDKLTIVMTTNIRKEVDRADKICILHEGKAIYEDNARSTIHNFGRDELILYADKTEYKTRLLSEHGYKFHYADGAYHAELKSHDDAVKLVSKYFDDFKRYEVKHGTLTDAYVNILDTFDKSRGY